MTEVYADSANQGSCKRDGYPDQTFWMCYVQGAHTPTYFYLTEAAARKEAERLASLPDNQGRRVFLLKAVAMCVAPPIIEWKEVKG